MKQVRTKKRKQRINSLVYALSTLTEWEHGGMVELKGFTAFNSNKIRKSYFRALLDVLIGFITDYFTKGYFFKLLSHLLLITILAFIMAMVLLLIFHLPELGKALNNI